jgi:hypothetical protein
MRRTTTLVLLAVTSLLLSTAPSCGGDGAGPGTSYGNDADTLLGQAQEAMRNLDSFRAEMTTTWEGRETTYTVAWQRPDSFHVLSPLLESQQEEGHEKTIVDKGLFEAMAIGDKTYVRQCQAEDEGCEPWQEGPREAIYVPVWAPELEPMWTIEVLGLVSDAQIVGEEDVEGVACTRIQGKTNVVRAMMQSWRRAEEERGPIYWGEECTVALAEPDGEEREECQETTLDEYIAMLQPSLQEQDQNPVTIEAWLGRDDNLVRSLEFGEVPAGQEPGALSFTFSRFDETNIKPPK